MSYQYQAMRPQIFTEDGARMLLKIRDNVAALLDTSGAVMMGSAIRVASGDSWMMLACVDYLVEIGELREISQNNPAGQHRIFVKGSP